MAIRHGEEAVRYLSIKYRGLASVRTDGTLLIKRPSHSWRTVAKRSPLIDQETWEGMQRKIRDTLPHWCRVDWVPTTRQLDHWRAQGVAKTTTGLDVAPDGIGQDGSPSWLLFFDAVKSRPSPGRDYAASGAPTASQKA